MAGQIDPGDCEVLSCSLAASGNSIDLRALLLSIQVYENVKSPTVVADITVVDSQELSAYLPIKGEEQLYLSFQTPTLDAATYNLSVTSIKDSNTNENGKLRSYTIRCVSPEVLRHKTTSIAKAYNTNLHNVVSDIYSTFLQGTLPLVTENTQGIQKFRITDKQPFQAIKDVLQRSSSAVNQSSSFLFFANQKNFNFVTLEGLMQKSAMASFTNDSVINDSIFNVTFRNIINYTINQQFDSAMAAGQGAYASQVKTMDLMNMVFSNKIINPANMNFANPGSMFSSTFSGIMGKGAGKSLFVPSDSSLPETFISQFLPNQKAFAAKVGNASLNVKINGDSTLKAGDMIFLNIVENTVTTGSTVAHPLLAGKYCVSKLCHNIGPSAQRPRYTQTIEAISGSYGS